MTKAVFSMNGSDSVPLIGYLLNTYIVSGIELSDTGVLRYVNHGTYPQEMFSPPGGS